jgi:hypothetical protein
MFPGATILVRISVSNLEPTLVISDLVTVGVSPNLPVGRCIGGANRKQNSRDSTIFRSMINSYVSVAI